MHPELRRARALYHHWRCLSEEERTPSSALAREVKELALDLRGHVDAANAELALARANDRLSDALRDGLLRAA